MSNENYVVNKICRQIEKYHTGHKPLILIDTQEIELANRVAGSCNVIDLHPIESTTDREKAYYDFLDADEKNLSLCLNFSTSRETLKMLYESAPKKLEHKTDPQLVLLQLRYTASREGPVLDLELTNELMNYVRCYVSTYDESSPVRSSCVLLFGKATLIPEDLLDYTQIISVDYPDFDEIKETILTICEKSDVSFENEESVDELARKLRGFTLIQTEFYVKMMVDSYDDEGKEIIFNTKEREKLISEAKEQYFKRFGKLKLYEPKNDKKHNDATDDNDVPAIGGMKTFLEWAKKVKVSMVNSKFSAIRGTDDYKGVLLAGISGCGKSHAAFAFHEYLGVPMLQCDFGSLMGKYVGESESNLRAVLSICEKISPCILWIDEMDKALSGTGSSSNDSGTSGRMLGYLLDWLQNNQSSCFVFATANNIDVFATELLRKDRFDMLYGVFLPTHEEIKGIFKYHMQKHAENREKRMMEIGYENPTKLFDDHPIDGCFTDTAFESIMSFITKGKDEDSVKFLSGADIKDIIKNALRNIDDEELEKPLSRDEWVDYLISTINSPFTETQGSSEANLNQIAECYIRLIRKGFVPVGENPLFEKGDNNYSVTTDNAGNINASYKGICPSTKQYDIYLFQAIQKRINLIATDIETEERRNPRRR